MKRLADNPVTAGISSVLGRCLRRSPKDRATVGEVGQLQQGEILVAPTTSPSWAPAFAKIGACITDVGGVMSHAAIVCREYGMPAVVGTGHATKIIKTGMRIRVDGSTGAVTIAR